MIAAMLLAAALVWLAIAVGAGVLLYRWRRKRWQQVAMTLFVIWLPFWDVIPGYYFYQKAVREVGGVRIYRTVQAEGYLDLRPTDCFNCWLALRGSPFKFIEFSVVANDPHPSFTLAPVPGFYEFRLLERGSTGCEAFEALPNVETQRRINGLEGLCVAVTRRAEPISRYEYSSSRGWVALRQAKLVRPVEVSWQRISDRVSGEVIAESMAVRFVTWISAQLEFPVWQHIRSASGEPIRFEVNDVVNPI